MHADNKFCGVLTLSTVSNILNILNVKCHCAVTENIHTPPPPIEVKVKMSFVGYTSKYVFCIFFVIGKLLLNILILMFFFISFIVANKESKE